MLDTLNKILVKEKVEFSKYFTKYAKFAKSASTLFSTEWKSHVLPLLVNLVTIDVIISFSHILLLLRRCLALQLIFVISLLCY